MKGGKRPLGYTIVEVMIVLAVSGVLFVIASNFISGKQGNTSFQQGSNELVSRLQTLIEEVTDGQYADIPLTCSASGPQIDFGASGGPNQGTQSDCIFLGKLAHFTTHSGDEHKYEVFTLAGARAKSDGTVVTDLNDSKLAPVINPGSSPNLTVQSTIPQNLYVTAIRINGTITSRGAFGFMQGLGSSHTVNGTVILDSGYQTVSLVWNDAAITSSTSVLPAPPGAAKSNITSSNIKYAQSAVLCISDGTRYARISVGPDGSTQGQLHVAIKQLGENPVCP